MITCITCIQDIFKKKYSPFMDDSKETFDYFVPMSQDCTEPIYI